MGKFRIMSCNKLELQVASYLHDLVICPSLVGYRELLVASYFSLLDGEMVHEILSQIIGVLVCTQHGTV